MDFEKLEKFACCELDVKICKLLSKGLSQREAAKEIEMSQSYLCERLGKLKEFAATRCYAPEEGLTELQPFNQILSGVSTLYDELGGVKARWVKTKANQRAVIEAARAMVAEMSSEVPKATPVDNLIETENALLNLYVLTDAHLGMYAHHEEGGSNWDLKIAETEIMNGFDYLVQTTPCAGTAILCNLGDLLHSDSMLPVTPTNQHVLDQDSRQHRVIKVAIRVIRGVMKMLLETHDKVVLINAQGNHDLVSALWLQGLFAAHYEDDSRVEVVVSPLPYYAYVHGYNLLAFTHGHKKRGEPLADLISGQFRELIGKTRHTFIHTGHLHSQKMTETPTSTIEQHPTIASRDSHASHDGWMAKRGMQAIVYHEENLEIARSVYRPRVINGNPH